MSAAAGRGGLVQRAWSWLGTHPTRRHRLNWTIWVLVVLIIIGTAAGKQQSTPNAGTASDSKTATAAAPTRPSPTASTSTPSATRPPSLSAPPGGSEQVLPAGVILPDPVRTPGAVNPLVTQADIGSTICVSGWTATIRPPSSYTTALKEQQLASGYSYRGDLSAVDYEEDHLISLELGGSPVEVRNLWPEPYAGTDGARTKDQVENRLHDLVCSGALSLHSAQQAIAVNWWAAYQRYVGPGPTPAPSTAAAAPPPAPATSAAHQDCTTTRSGNCIRAGQFCPRADYGQTGYDANGTPLTCRGDSEHPQWE